MKDNKKKEMEKANNVKLRKEGGRVRSRSPVRVSVEEEDVENNRKRRKDRNDNKEIVEENREAGEVNNERIREEAVRVRSLSPVRISV